MNELSKIEFANIRKIVRPERQPQAVLDWSTGGGMPMGRDVDAGLAGFAAMRWVSAERVQVLDEETARESGAKEKTPRQ